MRRLALDSESKSRNRVMNLLVLYAYMTWHKPTFLNNKRKSVVRTFFQLVFLAGASKSGAPSHRLDISHLQVIVSVDMKMRCATFM